MNTVFLFEDGHGNAVDENGGLEPMEYIVDQNEFVFETIATHTDYLKNAASSEASSVCPMRIEKPKDEDIRMREANVKRDYVRYTVQDKRWVKQYTMCPDSIFETCKQIGRKCILTEEHKTTVINFIDANPSAAVVEVTEHLLKRFHDLKVSCSTVYNFMRSECNLSLKKADFHSIQRNSPAKMEERHDWVRKWENTDMNFLTNCVFLDESAFDINMKRSRAWSKKGTRAIVTRPTTRANTTTILGAISAAGLITIGVKKKKSRPAKKRKADGYICSETVTGHYISFLKATLDEMDKHPHMKGHYILMDNAPIHTNENINILSTVVINVCIFLPTLLSLTQ
ncbi:hypothetical protein BCV71DRAFT_262559 [Rhizopus microsporus]|uniref:Tc1-like transposase DDE domain-containing protein n=1 Tax=Rhizopus microsporus TaxID=58291 RepID=A0A1X0S6F4_RHIZD|nr:hypothetical protein BCV71DRAFT_262559 [Rhizopus microsporus]